LRRKEVRKNGNLGHLWDTYVFDHFIEDPILAIDDFVTFVNYIHGVIIEKCPIRWQLEPQSL
jgi:hypothetical protein